MLFYGKILETKKIKTLEDFVLYVDKCKVQKTSAIKFKCRVELEDGGSMSTGSYHDNFKVAEAEGHDLIRKKVSDLNQEVEKLITRNREKGL